MLKSQKIADPDSCLNKANDNEYVFVLLERDPTISNVIRYWIKKRIEKKLNVPTDAKLIEAENLAK